MSGKRLYILRHAKAETGSPSQDDHERGLVEQGFAACDVMGKYIKNQAIVPALILCSTAKRALETWKLVKNSSKINAPEEVTDRLYLASANEILGQLASMPETVDSVMIVGHNPGLHQLCLALAKKGDEGLFDRLHLKFPTCALASIDLGEVAWRDIASSDGVLKAFITPRILSSIHADE